MSVLGEEKKGSQCLYVEVKPNPPTPPSPCGLAIAACRSRAKRRPLGRRRKTARAPLRSSVQPAQPTHTQSPQGNSQSGGPSACVLFGCRWIPIPQATPQERCRPRQFASKTASRRRPCSQYLRCTPYGAFSVTSRGHVLRSCPVTGRPHPFFVPLSLAHGLAAFPPAR